MYYQRLSDEEILRGFRKGNEAIIREYFYGYCRVGYHIFDKRYQLSGKENLDFMSLAHQYALYLMEHGWKPLEDHSPNISLKTWLINGFRYVVLDALKWYRKEYGSITFEDYLRSFDVSDDLRLQFNRIVEDLCDHAPLDRKERLIINMLLLQGFKSKEIAVELGMTPSAISQKYKKLKEEIVVPYFKKHFDMDMDMPEVMDERALSRIGSGMPEREFSAPSMPWAMADMAEAGVCESTDFFREDIMEQKRTTPELITELKPNEMGQGVGLQGQSYAIPTMQGGVDTIKPYVDEFIRFAKEHPELTFLVTKIGCGIAGFTEKEIAPLFYHAIDCENVVLPKEFDDIICRRGGRGCSS